MTKNLVIVESPAKARTIERYLGKDYAVKSSFGHVRDLPKKGLSIDLEHGFAPSYEISPDKKKTVAELKKAAKSAETIWLASDEDREGEAIAWHICQVLNLDDTTVKRIVFHEITKSAIENAIKNPRAVDKKLVDAQQARRVLDRLVGYELSPVLWKKVRPGLSAGRVQSVAVRLIVEREREIKRFNPKRSFSVIAVFKADQDQLPAELSAKFDDDKAANQFLMDCKAAKFRVSSIERKPGMRNPSAPFTTSTLQQEAAGRLGYSVRQTMTLAQRLYEAGHITYMRTDSTTLSSQAISAAEAYIKKKFGKKYHKFRQFKTKNRGAQEAHEAIRPTNFAVDKASNDDQEQRLYNLIWRRALASQMAPAEIDRTEVGIAISTRPEKFIAKGELLKFDGFFKVYGGGKEDVILPELKPGQMLDYATITAAEVFSKSPARYSEASLVRKLEDLGIGRPSTYAPTITTIQTRGYVERRDVEGRQRNKRLITLTSDFISTQIKQETFGADKAKLLPTTVADITTDFLVKHFSSIVDYAFTARVEDDFDTIAAGKQTWNKMIADFYKHFHPLVEQSENVSRQETTQTRKLGNDPKTGKPIMARFGRYGPMLQRGETKSEEKPDFAPLPAGVELDEINLKQALEMFKLPRIVGRTEAGEEIRANIGRFGPYVQVGKIFVSLKEHDPMKVTEQESRELYKAKLKQVAEKHIQEFDSGVKILRGPYGPYVTDGKKNARIPKEEDPQKLTEAQAKEILAAAPAKKGFRRRKKR